ncbi:MAG: AAA family ATPase [Candidatus Omnitrophota bacterium]
MNIIKRIVIDNFRSIKHADIDCEDINVFSGLNDTGKSNVLRALNLYFNRQTDFLIPIKFTNDYSKVALASAQRSGKQKQQIKIKLFFNAPDSFKSLRNEKEIFIEKIYSKEDEVILNYSNEEYKKKSQITRLHNKINYFYIPALKGPNVLQFLLGRIGEEKLITADLISMLNTQVNSELGDLKDILEISLIKTKTTMGFPVFLRDFWEKLTVNTEYDKFSDLQEKTKATKKGRTDPLKNESYQIPLDLRGEGIKSKYVPPLLKWLQHRSPSDIYVWGIDEPENSLEFKKADELANLYYSKYATDTQLFLTTHSLAFIFPKPGTTVKPTVFRCFEGDFGQTAIKKLDDLFNKSDRIKLADEMGALEIQKEVYENWREKNQESESQKKLIDKYESETCPVLYVEGSTDKKILTTAWSKLHPSKKMPFSIEHCESASYLKNFIKNNGLGAHNRVMIGMWDCDKEGYEQLKGLFNKDGFNKISCSEVKHQQKNIWGFALPTPANRVKYTNVICENPQFQYLEIEHYFTDKILKKYDLINSEVNDILLLKKDKSKLANSVDLLKVKDFANFEYIFKKILKTMGYKVKKQVAKV